MEIVSIHSIALNTGKGMYIDIIIYQSTIYVTFILQIPFPYVTLNIVYFFNSYTDKTVF